MTEDFQPQIFEFFAQKLEAKFPGVKLSSVITDQPPSFPCVQIEQDDLPTDHDISGRIRFVNVRLRVRVYTTGNTKTSQARKIQMCIDEIANSLNFTRQSYITSGYLYQNSAYRTETTYRARMTEDGVLTRT